MLFHHISYFSYICHPNIPGKAWPSSMYLILLQCFTRLLPANMTYMETRKENINQLISSLNERNKELSCLYKADELLRNTEQPMRDAFRQIIPIIPPAFRYEDICGVRIRWNDQEVTTPNYVNTALKITVPIIARERRLGDLTVVYIKPVKSEKGIFLPEEHKLLSTLAEKLGQFIHYKKLRISLEKLEKKTHGSGPSEMEESEIRLKEWLRSLHLNKEEIERVLQFRVHFRKGETICKQGAITAYVMLLAGGLTKNYLEGVQGKGFNFKIVTPFDFIGASSVFGSNRYLFSGSALVPSTVYMIEKSIFRSLALENPDFNLKVMEWFSHTTEYHLDRLSCIASKQSLGRISHILLYLMNDVFHSPHIPAAISRKDIAELAGMSVESAVRMLSELKKDKIIRITNQGLTIEDTQLLKTLSRAG